MSLQHGTICRNKRAESVNALKNILDDTQGTNWRSQSYVSIGLSSLNTIDILLSDSHYIDLAEEWSSVN